jgi:hypothetical protein
MDQGMGTALSGCVVDTNILSDILALAGEKQLPSPPSLLRKCEENHTEGVKQFTQGTRFLLTTDLSCSYHGAKSGFLFEFLKNSGKSDLP